ncbi:MAG: PAS domain-containing protein [Candidatus Krumholzibacteria bacterium]|nr:PAS domain-containing protein [Candidatus Krumholzibacteria bacterium]
MKGKLPREIVDAVLETIPLEMTVLDENDRIVWWNTQRPRFFERAEKVLGTDVRACHSVKSLDMVERLLSEMKAGERESARFWYNRIDDGVPRKLLVDYFAIRDGSGRYIGCIETLQDVAPFRFIEGEKRELDA